MTSIHRNPKPETLEEVVTVKVVFAIPLARFTAAGANAQVIPATGEQENVTLFAKPPVGVTVNINWVDCPAMIVTVVGFALREKSGLATVRVTGAEVLAENFSSPG